MAADDDLDQRFQMVEKLVQLFKLERMVYLTATTTSLLMLLGFGGYMLYKDPNPTVAGFLFGSTGIIGYSVNRLLRMWDQALMVLMQSQTGG